MLDEQLDGVMIKNKHDSSGLISILIFYQNNTKALIPHLQKTEFNKVYLSHVQQNRQKSRFKAA
jgi:hypothetical protein